MDMAAWLAESRSRVDQWIADDVNRMNFRRGSVEEAMAYSLMAGGKRLRPQLVLAAAEYMNIDSERVQPAALAVEYLHTYSLIHDDLPAMDDDDLRRGKPTSHKVFGEAMAILAGDALLTEAFVKMGQLSGGGFASAGIVSAIRCLAQAAGRNGLVRGQVEDLAAEGQEITVQALEAIHRKKTGALFEACLAIPALLAEDAEQAAVLSSFGRHFGLAFQMVDDILNVIGDAHTLGKATGTDAGLGKATYPRLMGIEAARALIMEHAAEAKRGLNAERDEVLAGLMDFAVDRNW